MCTSKTDDRINRLKSKFAPGQYSRTPVTDYPHTFVSRPEPTRLNRDEFTQLQSRHFETLRVY